MIEYITSQGQRQGEAELRFRLHATELHAYAGFGSWAGVVANHARFVWCVSPKMKPIETEDEHHRNLVNQFLTALKGK